MASPNRSTARAARVITRRRSKNAPNALQLLKDDHARVKVMFSKFERADSTREKERLASTICNELTAHAELEEKIFYPAVREAIEDEEIMNEADVEHESAKTLIGKIRGSDTSDDHFDAMVTFLSETIKHHVKEEEGEMFKQVRRTDLDLVELGERMQEFKRVNSKKER